MTALIWNEEDARKSYIAQGREEGREENLIENIRTLMKNLKLTAEAAMNALGISPDKQRELAPLI